MKRPTLTDAAHRLLAWNRYQLNPPISGLSVLDDGTVSTKDVPDESTITPGRSDKDQVFRWLYERHFDLCKEWMDWAETKLEAENRFRIICGECQTDMIEVGRYKNMLVTDISFRCPNEDCPRRLSGVRLRYEEASD